MFTLEAKQPVVVEISEGASITLAPSHPRIVAAARAAVSRAMEDRPDISGFELSVHFSFGVLQAAITGWEGFADADGEPLECTPDTILLALDDDTVFDILDREYVFPLNLRELEKKGLAASPAGTSEQATAESDIANTPATSESTPETED